MHRSWRLYVYRRPTDFLTHSERSSVNLQGKSTIGYAKFSAFAQHGLCAWTRLGTRPRPSSSPTDNYRIRSWLFVVINIKNGLRRTKYGVVTLKLVNVTLTLKSKFL